MIKIKEVDFADCMALLKFEVDNRTYFEKYVPPRNSKYYSIEGVKKSLDDMYMLRRSDEYYMYLILNQKEEILGRINLFNIDREIGHGEIGYRVGEVHTGNRYASRAVDLLIPVARNLGLTGLSAQAILSNYASLKVLENSGFFKKNVLKDHIFWEEQYHDAIQYFKYL
ncbi:GNAT family N-acetyltransferase [Mesobacillus harenae]|uniref:GNAT family N-acetyltransferase n=1 Tax=Mesobacillus harenae TaxID=2213203 RepID=UPI0015805F2F